jgi:hypothetical protein
LDALGAASAKLGSDVSTWLSESPSAIQSRTFAHCTSNFESITHSFLGCRLDPHVTQPLARFQNELDGLKAARLQVSAARKKVGSGKTEQEAAAEYERLNREFIDGVAEAVKTKEAVIAKVNQNFIAIMSQYLRIVCQDVQKLRTVMPDDVFKAAVRQAPAAAVDVNHRWAQLDDDDE